MNHVPELLSSMLTTDSFDPEEPLIDYAARCFADFVTELRGYGVIVDPKLDVCKSENRYTYYDLDAQRIYLSLPDPQTPRGRLEACLLSSILGCGSLNDLMTFFRLITPWIVAHELGHHLRHQVGRFGENLWEEEHIANRLASALTRRRLSPAQRKQAASFLRATLDTLAPKVQFQNAAILSYDDVLRALNATGTIDDCTLEHMQIVKGICGIADHQMERFAGGNVLARLSKRGALIQEFNESYLDDFATYAYYQAGWQCLGLAHHGADYVADFARDALDIHVPMLAPIEDGVPQAEQVVACFCAYQDLLPRNPAGSRFFYRRYRELLWAMLGTSGTGLSARQVRRESAFFLECWSPTSDPIGYLAQTAPPALRCLFPAHITQHPLLEMDVAAHLPTETDCRLWKHVMHGTLDDAAALTLTRLESLDKTDVFRGIPTNAALEIVRNFCLVRFAAGETIVWEGDANDDVFFVVEGRADVLVQGAAGEHHVGTIREGEVLGESAFLDGDVRMATVRATVATSCLVVKDTDLIRIAYKHPSVLMQLAGAVARRQRMTNQSIVQAEVTK